MPGAKMGVGVVKFRADNVAFKLIQGRRSTGPAIGVYSGIFALNCQSGFPYPFELSGIIPFDGSTEAKD